MSPNSPRSDAQREASRINGAKSHGPASESGKLRSSQNGIKHGLRSSRVVLANENPAKYQALLAFYVSEYQPLGITESSLLVRMVNTQWVADRIESMRDGTIDNEQFIEKPAMDASFSHITAGMRHADAACSISLGNPGMLEYYGREYDRLNRIFERCKRQLDELQSRRGVNVAERKLQPVSLIPVSSEPVFSEEDTPENTTEPDLLGPNFDEKENFWWISTFICSSYRSKPDRTVWISPGERPPEDKVA